MLVKLTAEQISREWPVVKHAIREALPPFALGADDRMYRILESLMLDRLHCWASVGEEGGITVLLTTMFTEDGASGIRNLMIYSLYALREPSRREWAEGFVNLRRFARARGCSRIIAYSDVPSVVQLVERFGGETKYRFLSMPIGESG